LVSKETTMETTQDPIMTSAPAPFEGPLPPPIIVRDFVKNPPAITGQEDLDRHIILVLKRHATQARNYSDERECLDLISELTARDDGQVGHAAMDAPVPGAVPRDQRAEVKNSMKSGFDTNEPDRRWPDDAIPQPTKDKDSGKHSSKANK